MKSPDKHTASGVLVEQDYSAKLKKATETLSSNGVIPKARTVTATSKTDIDYDYDIIVNEIEALKASRQADNADNALLNKQADEIMAKILKAKCKDTVELLRLLALANGYKPEKTDAEKIIDCFQTCGAFIRKDIKEPLQVIKGVLYKGRKMSINASSKVGKTKLAMLLGMSVSEGLPVLGMQTTKTKLLYLNLELGEYESQDRLSNIKDNIIPNEEADNFIIFNYREYLKHNKGKPLIDLLPELAKEIAKMNFGLIIIDPIYKLYDAELDENSANNVALLLNSLESIVNMTDAAIIYLHHYSKGDASRKSSRDRSSGSGVFTRDPDTILNVTELEDKNKDDAYVVEFILRSFAPKKPIGIRINGFKIVTDTSLNVNNLKKVSAYKQVFRTDEIVSVLALKPYKTVASLCDAVREETGMSKTVFYDLWKAAKKLDGVTQDKDDNWTYTTPSQANN